MKTLFSELKSTEKPLKALKSPAPLARRFPETAVRSLRLKRAAPEAHAPGASAAPALGGEE